MKRYVIAFAIAALVGAAPALGDAGAPGTTFPEQPGTAVQGGCAAVTSNPGTGPNGAAGHFSPTAAAITSGLIADACFGG